MKVQCPAYLVLLRLFAYSLLTFVLAACGGGGGSPGERLALGNGGSGSTGGTGGTGGTGSSAIQLVLFDSSGTASNQLNSANPLVARALVRNANGTPVANTVVTFELGSSLATLSPRSGTALTDANGLAQISIRSANAGSGAAEITAKAAVGGTDVSAKAAFSIGASATATPTAINFVSASPSDKSIVIKGAGGNGRTEIALLTFSVVDNTNVGVPNVPVVFSMQSSGAVTLVSSESKTDANGNVSVAVNSGSLPTTVRVIATVAGTAISALSDTVTVTTGQPIQAAFTLALEKYYVEGVNWAGTENKVSAYLADQFGAAVADGTQVVFSTDTGAIVGDGGARCLTSQGACTVTWRSQNPLTSTGFGTILATATNAAGPLSSSVRFFNSGSEAFIYLVSDKSRQGATTRNPESPVSEGTLNLSSCVAQEFAIEVVDLNGNPLPEGTKIEIVNASDMTMTVFPDTVMNSGLPFSSETRGTVHTVKATASGCSTTGTVDKVGSAIISLKTPRGTQTTALTIKTTPFKGN